MSIIPSFGTTIRLGHYVAHLLADPENAGVYHWSVQRVDFEVVLHNATERSFDAAVRCAKQFLQALDAAQ